MLMQDQLPTQAAQQQQRAALPARGEATVAKAQLCREASSLAHLQLIYGVVKLQMRTASMEQAGGVHSDVPCTTGPCTPQCTIIRFATGCTPYLYSSRLCTSTTDMQRLTWDMFSVSSANSALANQCTGDSGVHKAILVGSRGSKPVQLPLQRYINSVG
jgi:hypothetical protein